MKSNFRNKFGQIENLQKQNVKTGGVAVIKHQNKRFVYYLITKDFSYQKPTYRNLFSSLSAMKEHMVNMFNFSNIVLIRLSENESIVIN